MNSTTFQNCWYHLSSTLRTRSILVTLGRYQAASWTYSWALMRLGCWVWLLPFSISNKHKKKKIGNNSFIHFSLFFNHFQPNQWSTWACIFPNHVNIIKNDLHIYVCICVYVCVYVYQLNVYFFFTLKQFYYSVGHLRGRGLQNMLSMYFCWSSKREFIQHYNKGTIVFFLMNKTKA